MTDLQVRWERGGGGGGEILRNGGDPSNMGEGVDTPLRTMNIQINWKIRC